MSEHSPAPWEWRDDDGMRRLAPGVLWLNDTPGSGGIWGDEIDRANAALIAAAPDLLAVIKTFVSAFEEAYPEAVGKDEDWIYDEHRGPGMAYLAALKAIAKATTPPERVSGEVKP